MSATERLTLVIDSNDKNAVKSLQKVNKSLNQQEQQAKKTSKAGAGLQTAWLKVAAVGATVAVALKKAVDAASDLEETASKFNVVFEGQIDKAEEFSSVLVESYAMSTREAKQYLSSVQDLLVPMGMASDQAADMSNEVVKLSADLGSFNNLPTQQVMMDLQSALVGNFETMKKYGVVLNETVIKERARTMGLYDGKGVMDASTKAQVAFQLAMEGSLAAQGDMIRTSDSYANVMKKLGARFEDVAATVGNEFLPDLAVLGQTLFMVSKDGTLFVEVLTGIGKYVGFVIKGFSNLIGVVGMLGLKLQKLRLQDQQNMVAIWKDIIVDAYGSISNARKAASSGDEKAIGMMSTYTKAVNEAASGVDEMNTILERESELRDQIIGQEEKASESLDANIEARKEAREKELELLAESRDARNQIELEKQRELNEELAELEAEENERKLESAEDFFSAVGDITNRISNLFSLSYKNDSIELDNWYKKKKKTIENTITDETEKEKALEKLEDEYTKKKNKAAREQAKTQKAMSLVNAIVGTAVAIVNALQMQPAPLGIAMAAIVGALGVAEIALIASQSIPAAAEGSLIKGSNAGTIIRAGEGGRSELIVPFENEEVMDRVGGLGGSSIININIENLNGNENLPTEFIAAIDRGLYELNRNKNSAFGESISG